MIHRLLPGTKPYTLLLLHGFGGDENDLVPVGRGLAPGAAILSPRGTVLEDGNARFFARLAPNVYDENEVRARVNELAEWVKATVTGTVYALGYSNGANTAAAMMMLHPEILAGAVLMRAHAVIKPEPLPDLNGAPVLILSGVHDQTFPEGATHELAQLLTKAKAKVEVAHQDSGHDLTPYDFAAGKQWFAKIFTA